MPCCSAYDALSLVTPLVADAPKKAAKKAAKKTKPAAGAARQLAAAPFDCKDDGCFNELNGGKPCPPGKCRCDAEGKPTKEHARPKCPKHDAPAPKVWGRGAKKK